MNYKEKFKHTSLGNFLDLFDEIGVEYEIIAPDKNSIDIRDILGFIQIKVLISSSSLSFDNAGMFISVLSKAY